jgi:hypothetical protein
MQAVSTLEFVKKWLESRIFENEIQEKAPRKDDSAGSYQLATPAVHVGYIPPGSILDEHSKIRIPCLVVGTPEMTDDRENSEIHLQITVIVYDAGLQTVSGDGKQMQLSPNFDGYITLMNFLDCVKEWILREDGIPGLLTLDSAVKLKTYEEQPWPYWYGYLDFTVSGINNPITRFAGVLN